MLDIYQTQVGGFSLLDPWTCMFRASAFFSYGDDGKIFLV